MQRVLENRPRALSSGSNLFNVDRARVVLQVQPCRPDLRIVDLQDEPILTPPANGSLDCRAAGRAAKPAIAAAIELRRNSRRL